MSVRSDVESNDERFIRLRQVETYLSVSIAVVRAVIVAVAAYVAWRLLSPNANGGEVAIGASAFFIVFADDGSTDKSRELVEIGYCMIP